MGKIKRDFQDTDYILRLFGEKVSAARKAYRVYVKKGIAQGRRPELVGGGLIRSAGGWSVIKAMRRVQDHMKHCHQITNPVRATMRAYASRIHDPRNFAILDGFNWGRATGTI